MCHHEIAYIIQNRIRKKKKKIREALLKFAEHLKQNTVHLPLLRLITTYLKVF